MWRVSTEAKKLLISIPIALLFACQDESRDPSEQELTSSDISENITSYLPINLSPRMELTSSRKKVFAHYFTPYPLSIDNKPPENDYYAVNYLDPYGEKKKFFDKGGLLRQRPIPRPPIPTMESFKTTDLRHEIQMAAAAGLDGFAINVLSLQGQNWQQTLSLFDLAAEDFDDFFILIMPDMNSALRAKPEELINLIKTLSEKTAAYRLDDGRLVVAPYLAENQSLQWWYEQKNALLKEGIDIALFPVYHNWRKATKNSDSLPIKLDELLYGVSNWGPRTVAGGKALLNVPEQTHQENLKWMGPVSPQDIRPKSLVFHEANNSATFRAMWQSAIDGDADWVHVISWNDYSEGTEIAPSTHTGYSFYDLNSFYIQWFKLGKPKIERDMLYAFYRRHDTSMKAGLAGIRPMKQVGGVTAENNIELLAFLTDPGILEIEINGKLYSQPAHEGINSFVVPLQAGIPTFRLLRNEKVVQAMVGKWEIGEHLRVHNLLYHGMSSGRAYNAKNSLGLSWPWRLNKFPEGISLTSHPESSPFSKQDNSPTLIYADVNESFNSGLGYSFKHSPTPTQVILDFKFLDTQASTQNFEVSITDNNLHTIFSIILHADSNDTRSETNEKTVFLSSNHWYRLSLTLAELKKGSQKIALSITTADGNKIYEDETLNRTTNDDEYGLLIKQIGAETSGRLLIDNVSATSLTPKQKLVLTRNYND